MRNQSRRQHVAIDKNGKTFDVGSDVVVAGTTTKVKQVYNAAKEKPSDPDVLVGVLVEIDGAERRVGQSEFAVA